MDWEPGCLAGSRLTFQSPLFQVQKSSPGRCGGPATTNRLAALGTIVPNPVSAPIKFANPADHSLTLAYEAAVRNHGCVRFLREERGAPQPPALEIDARFANAAHEVAKATSVLYLPLVARVEGNLMEACMTSPSGTFS